MMTYLIQVNIALVLFYVAYQIILKQETNFRISRLYLLFALLASIIIPLLDLNTLSSWFINNDSSIYEYWLPDLVTQSKSITEIQKSPNLIWDSLVALYCLGALFNLGRVIVSFIQLRNIINTSKPKQDSIGWYYLLNDKQGSFSFFNYVFLGSKTWHSQIDQKKILAHERAHANCLHSADVILVQLITAMVWFNPVIYWYQKHLERLHEFEADEIASENDANEYCELLVRETINAQHLSIANHFNKSLTLKRIDMLKSLKHKMSKSRKLGIMATVLIIVILVACEEKVLTDLKKASGEAVLLTEYPKPVLDALDKIKQMNPHAEPKVYGLVRTNQFEDLDLKGKTATVIYADSDPDYKLYVILGADEINYAASNLFEIRNGERVYSIVQQPANPVGGMTEFYSFIAKNLKYPEQARRMGVEGRVFVKFMVDEQGKLSNFQVIRGIGAGCDAEAIRVLEMAENWNPGMNDGKAVKSTFNLAIIFKLNEKSEGD